VKSVAAVPSSSTETTVITNPLYEAEAAVKAASCPPVITKPTIAAISLIP